MSGDGRTDSQEVVTGAVTAAAQVISIVGMSVALAALLFTGTLDAGLPGATGSFIVASGAVGVWLAFRSGVVPLVTIAQDAPAIVLVAVIARIIDRSPDIGVEDVVVLIAVSTAAAGVVILVLGALGVGEAVRFLPTVVVDGFIAGTGWLLIKGGFEIVVGRGLGLGDIADLFGSDLVGRWLPGLALAIVVLLLSRSDRVPDVAVSGAVVLATAAFFAAAAIWSSVGRVEDDGWLIGPFDNGVDLLVVGPNDLADADWGAIGSSVTDLLSLIVVTTVALLLNLSALEATFRQRYDTNAELRRTGIANIGIATLGSVPAYHALGDSVLAKRMGVRSRAVGVLAGCAVIALGVFGAGLVGFAPLFVAGGLLIAVGLGLMVDWATGIVGPIGWVERSVSFAIVAVIMFVGILEGVLVGLVLACGVFVWRYSRVDPIRRASTGVSLRSRVDRSIADAERLSELGAATLIFELQGYIFFGSATRLVDAVRTAANESTMNDIAVVLDLRFTTGVDPGAGKLLVELCDELIADGVDVAMSGGSSSIGEALRGRSPGTAWFDTLDEALAAYESLRLAASHGPSDDHDQDPDDAHDEPSFLAEFERSHLPIGSVLVTAGEASDTLAFLVSGTASAYAASGGERHRVRQFVGPAWVGEIGFLRDAERSADVEADTDLVIATIDREAFERLRSEQPDVVIAILDHIAVTVADRAATVTEALMRSLD